MIGDPDMSINSPSDVAHALDIEFEAMAKRLETPCYSIVDADRLLKDAAAMLRRLKQERDDLAVQLSEHEPSTVERNMQEVMRINNQLLEELTPAREQQISAVNLALKAEQETRRLQAIIEKMDKENGLKQFL